MSEATELTLICRQCGGDGKTISDRNNNGVFRDVLGCPACKGKGNVPGYYCTPCGQHVIDGKPCGCGARRDDVARALNSKTILGRTK